MIETKYWTPLGVVLIDPIGAERNEMHLILQFMDFIFKTLLLLVSASVAIRAVYK
jgi:hypothetical protein